MLFRRLSTISSLNINFKVAAIYGLLIGFTSCSSSHYLKKEQYDMAFHKSLTKLQYNAENTKEKAILVLSARKLYEQAERRKVDLDYNQNRHLRKGIKVNQKIINQLEDAMEYDESIKKLVNYANEENTRFRNILSRKLFASGKLYYLRGEESGDKYEYLRALQYFKESMRYDLLDSSQYYAANALHKGRINVLVQTFSPWESFERSDIDHTFQRIERNNDPRIQYFYQESRGNESMDYVIALRFGSIERNRFSHSSTESFTKEVKTGEKVEKDTSGIEIRTPIYTTVHASATTIEETLSVHWTADYKIDSPTGYMQSKRFNWNAGFRSVIENITTCGDERALPSLLKCTFDESHPMECHIIDNLIGQHFHRVQQENFLQDL